MVYRYSACNLLQEPNSYMYPPFEGGQFLNEYFSSRYEKLACLDFESEVSSSALVLAAGVIIEDWVKANASPGTLNNWGRYYPLSATVLVDPEQVPYSEYFSLGGAKALATLPLLQAVVTEQLHGSLTKAGDEIWRKVVQRFEVTKRLYEFYDPDLKKGHGGHTDLRAYALLSLSCALHYAATGSLVALNAQIKLNDILCSLPNNQLRTLQFRTFKLLVCSEIAFIDELIHRKEINLGP